MSKHKEVSKFTDSSSKLSCSRSTAKFEIQKILSSLETDESALSLLQKAEIWRTKISQSNHATVDQSSSENDMKKDDVRLRKKNSRQLKLFEEIVSQQSSILRSLIEMIIENDEICNQNEQEIENIKFLSDQALAASSTSVENNRKLFKLLKENVLLRKRLNQTASPELSESEKAVEDEAATEKDNDVVFNNQKSTT